MARFLSEQVPSVGVHSLYDKERVMNPDDNRDDQRKPINSKDDDNHPAESFPPFDDPAFSPKPAQSPSSATGPSPNPQPTQQDPIFADHPEFSQDAAKNTPPTGIGNSEPLDDVNEKTRHSDGQNLAVLTTPSPDTQKFGAGPAIAEHSKDAWEKSSSSDDDSTEHSPSGAPGTTDQRPRWEGPPENRPRGYLPAVDDPETDRDAAGANLMDPEKRDTGDALKTRRD
jgi:hypothetical protein